MSNQSVHTQAATCRVCLGEDATCRLCRCNMPVHLECLKRCPWPAVDTPVQATEVLLCHRWIDQRGGVTSTAALRCEICTTPFNVVVTRRRVRLRASSDLVRTRARPACASTRVRTHVHACGQIWLTVEILMICACLFSMTSSVYLGLTWASTRASAHARRDASRATARSHMHTPHPPSPLSPALARACARARTHPRMHAPMHPCTHAQTCPPLYMHAHAYT